MKQLAKAVINVMKAVKGIEKNMTVGSGSNAYKGVSDKDVKDAIGKAMEENGLCILPVSVAPDLQIEKWMEKTSYGDKPKMQAFVSVKTRYLLLHESGESLEICGYGHGVDSQDKAAGKATTYALKYALLYAFMVPTGKIDDADNVHPDDSAGNRQQASGNKKAPAAQQQTTKQTTTTTPVPLVKDSEEWNKALAWLRSKPANKVEALLSRFILTDEQKTELNNLKNNPEAK